jgi:hypothetical protein
MNLSAGNTDPMALHWYERHMIVIFYTTGDRKLIVVLYPVLHGAGVSEPFV